MNKKENKTTRREIVSLDIGSESPAAEVLSRAFAKDPMFQAVFHDGSASKYLRSFFSFIICKSVLLQERLFGIQEEGVLRGVASLELPTSIRGASLIFKPGFMGQVIKLLFRIPMQSFAFINQYMSYTSSVRPKEPHYYLVFVGIDEGHQGKGLGRMLLEYIHALADQDSSSAGIGLDTENVQNVKFYEGYGYQVVGTRTIGAVTIYCMFRTRKEATAME